MEDLLPYVISNKVTMIFPRKPPIYLGPCIAVYLGGYSTDAPKPSNVIPIRRTAPPRPRS